MADPLPKVIRQMVTEAKNCAINNDHTAAVAILSNAIQIDNKCPQLYFNRSLCYHSMKEYDLAYDDIRDAIKYDNTQSKYVFKEGVILLDMKRFRSAEMTFNRAKSMGYDESLIKTKIRELIKVFANEIGYSDSVAMVMAKQYDSCREFTDAIIAGHLINAINGHVSNGNANLEDIRYETNDRRIIPKHVIPKRVIPNDNRVVPNDNHVMAIDAIVADDEIYMSDDEKPDTFKRIVVRSPKPNTTMVRTNSSLVISHSPAPIIDSIDAKGDERTPTPAHVINNNTDNIHTFSPPKDYRKKDINIKAMISKNSDDIEWF